jgi:hypothetical protein
VVHRYRFGKRRPILDSDLACPANAQLVLDRKASSMDKSRRAQPGDGDPSQRRRLAASVGIALLAAVASLAAAVSCEPVGSDEQARGVRQAEVAARR